MRSQEFTGKTTQEAIDAGLAALGVTIADVHVDVIQEGAKGLFGLFGSKPACVRLTVLDDEKEDDHGLSDLLSSFSINEPQRKKTEKKPAEKKQPEKKAEKKPEDKKAEEKKPAEEKKQPEKKTEKKPEEKKEAKPQEKAEAKQETAAEAAPRAEKPRQPREKKPRAPKAETVKAENEGRTETAKKEEKPREYAPMTAAKPFVATEPPVIHDEATPAGRAQRFLMDVTKLMKVDVQVYVDDSQEDGLYIHMIGDTLGILIGRRGETLDALQYLTSLQVNKGREGYIRVTLDTENYRAKREDSLRRLAQRMANRAQKTGRKVVLEPMNPYERRVLHTALQNHPAVTTHSEGEEPNRRVVIMLAGQPERAEQAEKSERSERGDKPSSSRRSRSRRRGHRGGKGEGAKNAQNNAQDTAIAPDMPAAEDTVDVLGGEE